MRIHFPRFYPLLAAVACLAITTVQAADTPPGSAPMYTLQIQSGSTKAISYRHLSGSTKIDFRGTPLAPSAKGTATVKSVKGSIQIDAAFEGLEPANKFGAEYLTYVLWSISPEGRATNLGELVLKKDKSSLKVTTQLQSFGLIVTAEPYFAVTQVSNVVLLENATRKDTKAQTEEITVKYDLLQRGQYSVAGNPADLKSVKVNEKVPPYVYQARNAVKIARAAGAEAQAPDSFKKAETLLQQAEDNLISKKNVKMVPQIAREATQTAEDSRIIALKRTADDAVTSKLSAADLAVKNAESARSSATTTADQAKTDAIRAQMAAEAAAKESLASKADALSSRADAAASRGEADQAKAAVAQAEVEKGQLREQLRKQLDAVLQTRDSARGLIVNMSGVLFDTGKYDLKPGAREKLAKVAGIVLSHPGLNLSVEGFTDNVGGDAPNQQLSENRAGAVRSYLVEQGIPAASVQSKGLGKANPVAGNETKEGRQQNRRVEIVVSGDLIGNNAADATPK